MASAIEGDSVGPSALARRPLWPARAVAWPVAATLSIALVVLIGGGVLAGPQVPARTQGMLGAALAAGFLPVGLFLLRHRPGHPVGARTWLVGVLAAGGLAGLLWNRFAAAAWVGQWAWWPALALIPAILAQFPAGPPTTGRARFLAPGLAGATGVSTVLLAAAAAFAPRTLLTDVSVAVGPLATWLLGAAAITGAATLLLALGVLARLVVLAIGSRGRERRQYLCLLPSLVLLLAGIAVDAVGHGDLVILSAAIALPVGIAVAVLQYQFEDLDLVIHRGVVWVVLTALVTGAWAGLLLAAARTPADDTELGAVVVLAALIVGLDPVRRRIQLAVHRWLFGRRAEPLALLAALGRRLADASTPAAIVETTVTELVAALKIPYAAIVVTAGGRELVLAEAGRTGVPPLGFPLAHDGERLGELRVSPRRAGEAFTAAERQILDEIARQASIAAHAHSLTLQVQESRDRIVRAREVERLRLRRDLHDGLGPLLAGARMQLSAVARREELAGGDASGLRAVLESLGSAGDAVRGIIDDLRPPALDDGLVPATRELVDSLLPDLRTEVVTGGVGQMAPAVEVAAYRILAEALTNVARHSGARRCRVLVAANGSLVLEIADDGVGIAPGPGDGDGVGLRSMRERAEELGGWVKAERGPRGRGTVVRASLPLGTCGNTIGPSRARPGADSG